MREIKFRAWFDGEMGKPFELKTLMNVLARNPLLGGRDFNEYILMQYTGLKDKNGKEIYEGDILETGTLICIVVWYNYRWSALWFDNRGNSRHPELGFRKHKIIGNIHENPELI